MKPGLQLLRKSDVFLHQLSSFHSVTTVIICSRSGRSFGISLGLAGLPPRHRVVTTTGPVSEAHEYLKFLYQLGPSADMTKVTIYASCDAAHKQVYALEEYKRHSTSAARLSKSLDMDFVRRACDSYKR